MILREINKIFLGTEYGIRKRESRQRANRKMKKSVER